MADAERERCARLDSEHRLALKSPNMLRENWKAIESAQVVQLDDADRMLLDTVQTRLDSSDTEFRHFLVLVGKIALAGPGRLAGVHLPKP